MVKDDRERQEKVLRRYYNKIKSQKVDVNEQFKKGHTKTREDIGKMTKTKTKEAYKKLISPLLKDRTKEEIMIKNSTKYKHRFQYITIITGKNTKGENTTLATIKETGRTIEEIRNQYQQLLKPGTHITSNNITAIGRKITQKSPNAKITKHENGIVTRVITEIHFRKG